MQSAEGEQVIWAFAEANQGLLSLLALLAAFGLAWVEYRRAEGAEARIIGAEISAAQSVLSVFAEILHLARRDGAAGGDFVLIHRKLRFETDRAVELITNLGSRVTHPGVSVLLGDLTSFLKHDVSYAFASAGSPEAAKSRLDIETAHVGKELIRVADALTALSKVKKIGKVAAIRPFAE